MPRIATSDNIVVGGYHGYLPSKSPLYSTWHLVASAKDSYHLHHNRCINAEATIDIAGTKSSTTMVVPANMFSMLPWTKAAWNSGEHSNFCLGQLTCQHSLQFTIILHSMYLVEKIAPQFVQTVHIFVGIQAWCAKDSTASYYLSIWYLSLHF